MNDSVKSSTSGLLESLVAVVINIIPIAIAIIGGFMVTLFGIRFLIRFVRGKIGRR
jgi:hypothetical protein